MIAQYYCSIDYFHGLSGYKSCFWLSFYVCPKVVMSFDSNNYTHLMSFVLENRDVFDVTQLYIHVALFEEKKKLFN